MSRRSKKDKQRGRRSLDYRAMMSLDGPVLQIQAFRTGVDAAQGIIATAEDGAAGAVTVYDVTCTAELPVGPDGTAAGITTRFDNSGLNYPSDPPVASVTSAQKPFSTHVHPLSGALCLGQLWGELQGKENLAELVLRVCAAYNFEDPIATERGFQPEAEIYRQDVLHGRPFNPNITWPVIPSDVFRVATNNGARPHVVLLGGAMPAPSVPRLEPAAPPATRVVVLSREVS